MTISVDATTLLMASAGVKTYLHYWLSALTAEAPLQGDRIRTYPLGVPLQPVVDHERSSANRLATQLRMRLVQLGNLAGGGIADLLLAGSERFHASQHTTTLPRRCTASATIFDLSCWITPQYHTERNIAATRLHSRRVWDRCAGLIAISEGARNDAVEVLRIPEERVRVIYPGIAGDFFTAADPEANRVRAAYNLTAPYILFVGCIEPRKNISGLLRAYAGTSSGFRRDVRLVIAGPLGWERPEVVSAVTTDARQVVYLSYVPETDIAGLFRGASAFVYPSYYEGFGLPVAQAMAAGAPVICSNRGSLPEVVGDAGIYVDPDVPEELSAALERVVGSPALGGALAERGRARARQFRWDRCARESLKFFHDL